MHALGRFRADDASVGTAAQSHDPEAIFPLVCVVVAPGGGTDDQHCNAWGTLSAELHALFGKPSPPPPAADAGTDR